MEQQKAVRFDQGKPRMDLIPAVVMRGMGEAFEAGSCKYADYNWLRGMPYSVLYAKILRHMVAWWSGEDNDPESGLLALKHALTDMAMLLDLVSRGYHTCDDRPLNFGPGPDKTSIEAYINSSTYKEGECNEQQDKS